MAAPGIEAQMFFFFPWKWFPSGKGVHNHRKEGSKIQRICDRHPVNEESREASTWRSQWWCSAHPKVQKIKVNIHSYPLTSYLQCYATSFYGASIIFMCVCECVCVCVWVCVCVCVGVWWSQKYNRLFYSLKWPLWLGRLVGPHPIL